MSDNVISQMQEHKKAMILKAEELISTGFPQQIVELTALLASPMFNESFFCGERLNVSCVNPNNGNGNGVGDGNGNCNKMMLPPLKRRRTDSPESNVLSHTYEAVPCNKSLCKMIDVVKPILLKLIDDTNLLKMWIKFMIPKIEDGNNFGVAIQEEVLEKIQLFESNALKNYQSISFYFLSRAKFISKTAKYPYIDDYRRAIVEFDEKEFHGIRIMVQNMRNSYFTVYEIIMKNIDKIKKPRSSNAADLY